MVRKISSRSLRTSVLSVLISLFLVLSFLAPAALADRSLTMDQIIVDAQVLPDASMLVTERITVDFSGQWNGFYVKIPQGDTPITDVLVIENGQPYTFNPGTEYGPPGTFLIKYEGSDILIDWSINAYDQVRTFDLSYRVVNAVKIYPDVAELYRKFIGEANDNKISYVQVNLTLPPGAEQFKQGEDIRIWGHGPLNGEVGFAGPKRVILQVSDLPPYTFMEGRVVMPVKLFSGAPAEACNSQPALTQILAEEQGWADQANKERTMARVETGVGTGILTEEQGWADQANKERAMARVETGVGAGILTEVQGWAEQANKEKDIARVGLGAGAVVAALGGVFMLWRRFEHKRRN